MSSRCLAPSMKYEGLAKIVWAADLLGSYVQLNVAYPLWHITLLARIRGL